MNEVGKTPRAPRTAPQTAPSRHVVGPGRPTLLDSYRNLLLLDDWFERVRRYCKDPPPDHARAADWILDNDYQVLRGLRRLKEDLPRHFYDKLPALAGPKDARPPRILAVAQAAYDGLGPQITLTALTDFIAHYQESADLTNAELWAMPSMLRLVCMERFIDAVATLAPDLMPPVRLSAGTLAKTDVPPVDRLAKAITNLITIDAIKWRDFVDDVSCIEAELSRDPAGVYPTMTFETRNRYRRVVEELAQRCDKTEADVARAAVALSQTHDNEDRSGHVGYVLIGDGWPALEDTLDARVSWRLTMKRMLSRHKGKLYAAGLVLLVAAAISVSVLYLWRHDATAWQWVVGLALSFLPATIPSVWFGHWIITRFSSPQVLPEMDFSKAIPRDCATAIVIPVIVASEAEVHTIAEKIEVLRAANPDPALRFVVLSDLADAQSESLPEDARIETALQDRIDALNRRHAAGTGLPFALLHRRRRHNPVEGCWMAWERKRGKLHDFNRYVLAQGQDAFDVVAGPVETLRGIRYAITLDADTQLPPGTAARLVGMLAHPLNRAVINPQSGRVVAGHAILQPRIEILPKLGRGTHFTHLYGGDTAIDIYSRAVSDVYQDLFGTGLYVGKGIYDIAALHRSMAGRIPDNHILSHDLFEGLHGRAALVSNIVLYEDLPATYPEFAMRHHRWMRGDWQLVPWLGRRVPRADGGTTPTGFSVLDRWKMVDNLRRSLMPPALLLFFLGGWLLLPGSALIWTVLALAAPGSYLIGEMFAVATGGIRKGTFGSAVHTIRAKGGRWFFLIVFLASDTLIALDAIFRTLWRVFITGRNRLEWTSAAHASRRLSQQSIRRSSWRLMWPSSAFAMLLAAHLALFDLQGFWPAVPVLLLWLIAPEISVWSARPRYFRAEALSTRQRAFLTLVARRTWHFFETNVGPADNWLPPDNVQIGDHEIVAHRTSPTNIGMFLVSALAARDLGFITTSDFVARGRNTIDTLGKMASYRGHLLNWYDTQTLEPLEPRYISAVDSGNLAVSLVTLKQGCLELIARPVVTPENFTGLEATLDLLCAALRDAPGQDHSPLAVTEAAIRDEIARAATSPLLWQAGFTALGGAHWQALEKHALDAIEKSPGLSEAKAADITTWLERFQHDLHATARDIDSFMPWLAVIADCPDACASAARDIADQLHGADTLADGMASAKALITILDGWRAAHPDMASHTKGWLDQLAAAAQLGLARQDALRDALRDLAAKADQLAFGMDFAFLYDTATRLFWIGYNQSLGKMDTSHYDLLATEARLASYFAIAKHDAPIEHWFAFSRPITRLQGKPSILSWNGSMFEYLMPPLFLPSYRDTLLGESELTAVDFQRAYCRERGVPWGISESAFSATDAGGTYQYRAFGVPGLGIRRGLIDDLVIAPYGSALALCGWPETAALNLETLAELGALTRYGFIEALDFTPDRVTPGRAFIPVTTFMAHHQGMVQTAIVNALRDDIMVRRFLRETSIRAMDLLLQERVPWDVPLERGRVDEIWDHPADTNPAPELAPWVPSLHFVVPQVHLLGNGRMSSLMTASGGGGLSLQDTALTRWQPDPTRTTHGLWIYLQDVERDTLWSLGSAPTGRADAQTRCVFHQHMVELLRRHDGIVARMDVTVAPFDDVEIRRVTLINEGEGERTIDLTTYAEVVLAPAPEDERHPAFSKLFVHSDYLPDDQTLVFTRRPRRPETRPPVLLHKLVADGPDIAVTAWETDRHRFVGRNRSARAPEGLRTGLGNTTGWTLDPVMALQARVTLKPMETRQLVFLTVASTSIRKGLQVAQSYPMGAIDHVFRDALAEAARTVHKLGIAADHLPELQVLSSLLVHVHQSFRTARATDIEWGGQPDLWRFGISGDFPILLLKLSNGEGSALLDILVRGQCLWRQTGLKVDLVILRQDATSYEEPLRDRILAIVNDTNTASRLGMAGGIHLVPGDQLAAPVRRGIEAAAHVVLQDENKTLREILDRVLDIDDIPPPFTPEPSVPYDPVPPLTRPDNLLFDNGYGGFDPETSDYLIHLSAGLRTPAPWCNVLANDDFGCLVSEAGLGATWSLNSGEHRLTPWSNDPVADVPGEVVYLRDEADGKVWTTTPLPMGQATTCQIRHGPGMTEWRQNSHGLEQHLTACVPPDDAVKLVRLRLRNPSGQDRRISVTYYAEWVLGALCSVARPHVVSHFDAGLGAIIARNQWNPEFAARIAFLTASTDPLSVSGDRNDFLGQYGDVSAPAGLWRWDLGGHFPSGGDACAAFQVHLDIPAGQHAEVVFAMGEVGNSDDLAPAIARWRDAAQTDRAMQATRAVWAKRLGGVQVKTPDPGFDLMINRWLPYQNRSCRIMARAGFYQAGGAFGFRDQLQDVLALLICDPDCARQHILLAARYQFEAGDVLHWWHPPDGRGVRTRCSDDYIWLAYVTARYVVATGDTNILDERVPFLAAPDLRPEEYDRYALFDHAEPGTLYDHCVRALDRMMSTGIHGLPLMGSGDWNDGMDRIGDKGQGESVWLAWFQIATVAIFAPIARRAGHVDDADRWGAHSNALANAISSHAWDGNWYLRAFDDDGLPWGSAANAECRIDLIAQAWAVLSGLPVDARTCRALQSAGEALVDPQARLIRLLTPPFDKTDRDPGYIRAYPPGIRENGGQYTHAAVWLGMAYAAIKDGNLAHQVFDIINPIRRASDQQAADRYRREPYVLAGDVSGVGAQTGQGGWSWYTGAAGWALQLGLGGILGVTPENGAVRIDPCLPTAWGRAGVVLDGENGCLDITIDDPDHVGHGQCVIAVDDNIVAGPLLPFPGTGKTSQVVVTLKPHAPPAGMDADIL